jgi:cyclophilin family peptidyl-prolyl cis-trans isomerase
MRAWILAALLLLASPPARAENPFVRFTTSVGAFDVELCLEVSATCERAAPATVGNFLTYVDRGDYASSVVHRSVPDFVIQGGSYRLGAGPLVTGIPTDPPVVNEFDGFTNRRGTISVPLLGDGQTACDTVEDSGTSGWFVNVGQNTGLDCGLFTVFGVVLGNGMQVVDEINDLVFWDLRVVDLLPLFDPDAIIQAFNTTPLLDSFTEQPIPQDVADAMVKVDITRVPEPGAAAGGIAAALALAAHARRARAR